MAQQAGQVSPDGQWVWTGTQWLPKQPTPIPIQGAYGPPWARPYESARFRATIVSIFLGANAVGILMLMVFDGMVIAGGGAIGNGTDAQVLVEGLVALIALIVYYGSFIPFLNLVHPVWSVLDAWRGSDPSARWTSVQARKAMGVPSLITGWWAAWLIGGWASNISSRMTNSDTPSVVVAGAWISILSAIVLVGAAALAILVVREVTARQDRKSELITSGRLS